MTDSNGTGDEADPPNLPLLIKLLKMTTSANDAEALSAMRMANLQLAKFGGDWERLLRGKVTVIGDPFEGLSAPVQKAQPAPPAPPPPRPVAQPWPTPRPTAQPFPQPSQWTAQQGQMHQAAAAQRAAARQASKPYRPLATKTPGPKIPVPDISKLGL